MQGTHQPSAFTDPRFFVWPMAARWEGQEVLPRQTDQFWPCLSELFLLFTMAQPRAHPLPSTLPWPEVRGSGGPSRTE